LEEQKSKIEKETEKSESKSSPKKKSYSENIPEEDRKRIEDIIAEIEREVDNNEDPKSVFDSSVIPNPYAISAEEKKRYNKMRETFLL